MRNDGERIFSAVHIRNQYFIRTLPFVLLLYPIFYPSFVHPPLPHPPSLLNIILLLSILPPFPSTALSIPSLCYFLISYFFLFLIPFLFIYSLFLPPSFLCSSFHQHSFLFHLTCSSLLSSFRPFPNYPFHSFVGVS